MSAEEKKLPPPVPESKIAGDMTTEEPLGWDQAPKGPMPDEQKRHSRLGGKGAISKPMGPDDKRVEGD